MIVFRISILSIAWFFSAVLPLWSAEDLRFGSYNPEQNGSLWSVEMRTNSEWRAQAPKGLIKQVRSWYAEKGLKSGTLVLTGDQMSKISEDREHDAYTVVRKGFIAPARVTGGYMVWNGVRTCSYWLSLSLTAQGVLQEPSCDDPGNRVLAVRGEEAVVRNYQPFKAVKLLEQGLAELKRDLSLFDSRSYHYFVSQYRTPEDELIVVISESLRLGRTDARLLVRLQPSGTGSPNLAPSLMRHKKDYPSDIEPLYALSIDHQKCFVVRCTGRKGWSDWMVVRMRGKKQLEVVTDYFLEGKEGLSLPPRHNGQ